MRSRTVGSSVVEEGTSTEVVPSDPILPREQKEEYPKTPDPENAIENQLVSTPYVTKAISTVWPFASYLSFIYMFECLVVFVKLLVTCHDPFDMYT